ncbi:MAG TPA: hypothetical protein PKE04_21360, partial [Clostridia bacterium]|nr:hypothetical protein [Clostridia bacterium]
LDDWRTVMTAFKEQKGATAPLAFTMDQFKSSRIVASAYGVSPWNVCYQENGVVKYGPLEPGFKSYLTTLRQWYEEGLLDPDFATLTANTRQAKVLSGEAGIAHGPTKGALAAWTTSLRETIPEAEIAGVPYPSLVAGEPVTMGQVNDPVVPRASISATCANPAVAMRFLDYGFSEAGHMLLNFGVEGVTYTLVDGKPVYTDFIMGSTEIPPLSLLNRYATSPEGNGTLPSIYDVGFIEQMNAYMPGINAALDAWSASNTFEQNLPSSVLPLAQDSAQYASVMNEIITYVDEMFCRFIMGQESFDNYDKFVSQVQGKGAAEAVAIMQRAYDNFLSR